MSRPRAALAMATDAASAVLDETALRALRQVCDLADGVLDDFTVPETRETLRDVELLVTGWGCPPLDAAVLAGAPRLRAVAHTAGSVRAHVTGACWDRGIEVSSAAAANAAPVAEYTVAMILMSGKRVLERARGYRAGRVRDDWLAVPRHVGNFRRTVGILSASMIGRRVIELLRPYDLRVLVHDPYVSAAGMARLGAEVVSLTDLFARSDVVSVHAPLLPETRGLVGRELIGSMRPDAVLINTARGAVLDQEALAEATAAGRIRAILDVTEPEVLPPDHPLWDDDNVLITPHLAGSQGNEWGRLAELAIAEVTRWASGEGFAHPVRREQMGVIA
ncbi:hydroxyacid dehydrogenase [Amycolatopsis cihanbeyliensis]|uniref:Phosphoglycerate dehydrogenase-like enzyme n=1 Tax=Amycolatopsis cihanbeyliensis TaxID=1128664 RepID=A0A542DQF5_AMYCI|nr:hydroxyacid dehydrogenase [Amycolatopsis cihanbeyliensis]TQJ05224.1 phosphoglycerate dehydrogenase-like enzyme [Amycolatopsis cihanbeyliensis]